MKKGWLYRTTRDIILHLEEIKPIDVNIKRDPLFNRKLRARWNNDMAEDLRGYADVTTWNKTGIIIHQQIGNICYVPSGTVVMYVETGKTGSYKLVCGDFIGWTSETTLLLEEIKYEEVDHAESKETT